MPASRMIAREREAAPDVDDDDRHDRQGRIAEPVRVVARLMPRCVPIQLMMLYWVSNIHFQAIALRAIGMVHGSRMMKRKTRVPGRFSASKNASDVPSTLLKIAATPTNSSVLRSAVKKTDDSKRR